MTAKRRRPKQQHFDWDNFDSYRGPVEDTMPVFRIQDTELEVRSTVALGSPTEGRLRIVVMDRQRGSFVCEFLLNADQACNLMTGYPSVVAGEVRRECYS